MKNCFAIVFTLISVSNSMAQDQEYAITLKNDTIYGKVSLTKHTSGSGQMVAIKNGKKKTKLNAHEVKSLLTKKGTFHTLKIRNQYQLARLEKEGYLSYYKFSGDANTNSLSFETPLLVKKTREQKEVPNIGFKKQVSAFLSDCESARVKFEAGAYKKNDLNQIIDDYNQCIHDNTVAINKKHAIISLNMSKASQIKQIKEAVNNSSSINDKVEINEMLDDVHAKLKAGEQIPNYLIGALKEKLASAPKLIENLLKSVQ